MTQSNEPALGFFLLIVFLGFSLPFIFNGFLAKSRGKNVFLMLLLTLFFSWLLTLILALMPIDRGKSVRYKKSSFKTILPFACLCILSAALMFLLDQEPDVTRKYEDKINTKMSSFTTVSNLNKDTLDEQESKDLNFDNDDIRKAAEDIFAKKNVSQKEKKRLTTSQFQYEILLFSGGKIYTDNAEIGKTYVKYKSNGGMIISLNRDKIKTMKRIKL